MSVYVSVVGAVRMDRRAFCALAGSPTIAWTSLSGHRGLLHLGADGEHFVLAAGDTYRNLGRHLAADLHAAAEAGEVLGAFDVVCTDGANVREVVTFDSGGMRYGSSDCLNEPVQLGDPTLVEHDFTSLGPFVMAGEPSGQWVAPSDNQPDLCGCGGYDDDGEPICSRSGGSWVGSVPVSSLEWGGAVGHFDETESLLGDTMQDLVDRGDTRALAGIGALLMSEVGDAPRWRALLQRWADSYDEVPEDRVAVRWAHDCLWRDEDRPRFRPWPARTGAGLYLTLPVAEVEKDADGFAVVDRDGYTKVLDAAVALAADGVEPRRALHAAHLLVTEGGARGG